MTFSFRLPPPPGFLAEPLGRLRQRIDERLDNPGIPDFDLPPVLARLISRLPPQPPALVFTLALNLALDRILPRDSLEPLQGRWLRLVVTDAGLTLDFHLAGKHFRPGRSRVHAAGGKPNITLTARTRDYLALALREEDADTLFFSRRLRMEGATDLGLLVKNTLDAVDWSAFRERLELFLPPRPGEAGPSSAL